MTHVRKLEEYLNQQYNHAAFGTFEEPNYQKDLK